MSENKIGEIGLECLNRLVGQEVIITYRAWEKAADIPSGHWEPSRGKYNLSEAQRKKGILKEVQENPVSPFEIWESPGFPEKHGSVSGYIKSEPVQTRYELQIEKDGKIERIKAEEILTVVVV